MFIKAIQLNSIIKNILLYRIYYKFLIKKYWIPKKSIATFSEIKKNFINFNLIYFIMNAIQKETKYDILIHIFFLYIKVIYSNIKYINII